MYPWLCFQTRFKVTILLSLFLTAFFGCHSVMLEVFLAFCPLIIEFIWRGACILFREPSRKAGFIWIWKWIGSVGGSYISWCRCVRVLSAMDGWKGIKFAIVRLKGNLLAIWFSGLHSRLLPVEDFSRSGSQFNMDNIELGSQRFPPPRRDRLRSSPEAMAAAMLVGAAWRGPR